MKYAKGRTFVILIVLSLLLIGAVSAIKTKNYNLDDTLTENLVGYWSFNDGTAADKSGNDNDGTIYDATVVKGIIENGLSFDGLDDYVQIEDTTDFEFVDQSVSVSAWFKILENDNVYRIFVSLGDVDSYPHIQIGKIRSELHEGKIYVGVFDNNQQGIQCRTIMNGDELPKDEWMHLVGVMDYEQDVMKLFLNGILQETQDLPNLNLADASDLRLIIGDYCNPSPPGYDHHHKGSLDEVRIYDKALLDEEVKGLFEEPFKKSIMIGKISNLQSGYNVDKFEAENLMIVQFNPFQILRFSSNEKITALAENRGILSTDFALGVFNILI